MCQEISRRAPIASPPGNAHERHGDTAAKRPSPLTFRAPRQVADKPSSRCTDIPLTRQRPQAKAAHISARSEPRFSADSSRPVEVEWKHASPARLAHTRKGAHLGVLVLEREEARWHTHTSGEGRSEASAFLRGVGERDTSHPCRSAHSPHDHSSLSSSRQGM
jgi:hypothetical protein